MRGYSTANFIQKHCKPALPFLSHKAFLLAADMLFISAQRPWRGAPVNDRQLAVLYGC